MAGDRCGPQGTRALNVLLLGTIVAPVHILWGWWKNFVLISCTHVSLEPDIIRHGFNPAPEWFEPEVRAIQRRRLNASELEIMDEDGIVFLRGVVPEGRVLGLLRETFTEKYRVEHDWVRNGLMHTFVRHGPLGELAYSAFGGKGAAIWNTQVEYRPGVSARTEPHPKKPWLDRWPGTLPSMSVHNDVGNYHGQLGTVGFPYIPQASFFLALSDIPYGLVLLAGSHFANRKHRCPAGPFFLDAHCMELVENGSRGERSYDMKAGDVVLFWGEVYHWTNLTPRERFALSIRYIPADHPFAKRRMNQGIGEAYFPPLCAPLGSSAAHPVVYPSPASASELPAWPLWPECLEGTDFSAFHRNLQYALRDYSGFTCDAVQP